MTHLLSAADWDFPVPIHYGPGRIDELPSLCRQAGIERPLVVTDRGSINLPFVKRVTADLESAGLFPELFADVAPNPTDANIEAGKAVFAAGNHDGVVALGGGSGMDAGKAISLVVGQTKYGVWDFDVNVPAPELGVFTPLICVPTTAGTGAETESSAIITDLENGTKGCVWHKGQKPRAALLDPELTLGLPKNLTAWTGVDAMVHAIEAYVVPRFNPLCDGAALEALRLITPALERVVENGQDIEARGALLVGSCLAGVSFIKGLGLVHAMSHMVGAVHDTHHGLTNAILLPIVLRYNRESIAEKVPAMAEAMGLQSRSFDSFYAETTRILDCLDIPRGLEAIGVPASSLPAIAVKAFGDNARSANPRASTIDEIEALLLEAHTAAR